MVLDNRWSNGDVKLGQTLNVLKARKPSGV